LPGIYGSIGQQQHRKTKGKTEGKMAKARVCTNGIVRVKFFDEDKIEVELLQDLLTGTRIELREEDGAALVECFYKGENGRAAEDDGPAEEVASEASGTTEKQTGAEDSSAAATEAAATEAAATVEQKPKRRILGLSLA
jgi:hypothetical protein